MTLSTQRPVVYIPAGSVEPSLSFEIAGMTESDYSAIQLRVRQADGTLLADKTAVVDDPGDDSGTLRFHFDWAAADLQEGVNWADLRLFIGGNLQRLPEQNPIRIISRGEV